MKRSAGRLVFISALVLVIGASFHGVMAQSTGDLRLDLTGPGPVAAATTTALFSHYAIGGTDAAGGTYTTTFTLLNTGSSALSGNLILTNSSGSAGSANLQSSDGSSAVGASIGINIPVGGITFITATTTNPSAPNPSTGWARVESSGGTLGGVATFALTSGGLLQTIAGVLSAEVTSVATIPVDDDVPNQRYTGYAVANPGSSSISIRVVEVSADGNTVTVITPVNLNPGQQTASFLFLDPKAGQKFRGSAVLIGQAGATFSVVALVEVQGATGPLFTAIPVIPAKAPNIN